MKVGDWVQLVDDRDVTYWVHVAVLDEMAIHGDFCFRKQNGEITAPASQGAFPWKDMKSIQISENPHAEPAESLPRFKVSYSFSATIFVEAEDATEAEAKVENMPTEELFDKNCQDGFSVEYVEEVEDEG